MTPPRKVRKTDEEEEKRTPDGEIRFDVEKISTLASDEYSQEVVVGGVPWKMKVWRGNILGASLYCLNNQSTPWSIDVKTEFTLVHSDNNKNLIVKKSDTIDNYDEFISAKLFNWDEFVDNEQEFIIDDKITLEIRFWISNMKGIKSFPLIDFTNAEDPCHDVTLVIDGEKIYVSKQILAVQSPVFKTLFYGEFVEKDMDEIELKDIDREEFVEMLQIIYPSSSKKITNDSVEYLLKLGDRFTIAFLMDRTEKFLIDSDKKSFSIAEKLRIAEKYSLFGLKEHTICSLKTAKDFKDIEESPIFDDLSDATVRLLFKKLAKIAK